MNSLDEALKSLNAELKGNPLIEKYQRLNKLIHESDELTRMRNEISFLQKCDDNEEEKQRYYDLLSIYNKNPLIIEFKNTSNDVYNLLMEIKDNLEL